MSLIHNYVGFFFWSGLCKFVLFALKNSQMIQQSDILQQLGKFLVFSLSDVMCVLNVQSASLRCLTVENLWMWM